MKKIFSGSIVVLTLFVFSVSVVSAEVTKTPAFVCPVFNDHAPVGQYNPNAVPIGGGDYTIIGPDVNVPEHATNEDGAGSPGGDHASPGDEGYSPLWNL